MARIDAHIITAERQWVTPADIVDAAVAHVGHALDAHDLGVEADEATVVQVDPRLTVMAQPCETMGVRAVGLLLQRIREPDRRRRTVRLAPAFRIRNSCGCA